MYRYFKLHLCPHTAAIFCHTRSAPIHHTLTVLACSFLHPNAPTGTTLKLLLTMPKLKKVDIRKRVEEVRDCAGCFAAPSHFFNLHFV